MYICWSKDSKSYTYEYLNMYIDILIRMVGRGCFVWRTLFILLCVDVSRWGNLRIFYTHISLFGFWDLLRLLDSKNGFMWNSIGIWLRHALLSAFCCRAACAWILGAWFGPLKVWFDLLEVVVEPHLLHEHLRLASRANGSQSEPSERSGAPSNSKLHIAHANIWSGYMLDYTNQISN